MRKRSKEGKEKDFGGNWLMAKKVNNCEVGRRY